MKIKKEGFSLVEGLLILIALALVSFAGYYVWNKNKSSDEKTDVAQTSENNTENNSEEQNASAPKGYKKLETQCYSLYVLESAKGSGDNGCRQVVRYDYGTVANIDFDFDSIVDSYEAMKAKTESEILTNATISDTNESTIDGQQAYTVEYTNQRASGTDKYRVVAVFVKDKGYQYQDAKISVINFRSPTLNNEYAQDTENDFDKLVQSVNWQ